MPPFFLVFFFPHHLHWDRERAPTPPFHQGVHAQQKKMGQEAQRVLYCRHEWGCRMHEVPCTDRIPRHRLQAREHPHSKRERERRGDPFAMAQSNEGEFYVRY